MFFLKSPAIGHWTSGAVGPLDAVLPGLRGDAPATWLDAAPPRGAAVGEQVGRAPAPVGAMAKVGWFQWLFPGYHGVSKKWLVYHGHIEKKIHE